MSRTPSKNQRLRLLDRDGFRCRYCGKAVNNTTAMMDHVIPFVAGGKTTMLNLVTCCRKCNMGKGEQLDWEPKPVGHYTPIPLEGKRKVKETDLQANQRRSQAANELFKMKIRADIERAVRRFKE